jgi:hypothetical protein
MAKANRLEAGGFNLVIENKKNFSQRKHSKSIIGRSLRAGC